MQTSKIAPPFPLEKRNVLYLRYGKRSGSKANQVIQSMLSSASLSTPSVAACGATTVWANGPIAPPLSVSILNGRSNALNGTLGSLHMATLHVGSLADKIV